MKSRVVLFGLAAVMALAAACAPSPTDEPAVPTAVAQPMETPVSPLPTNPGNTPASATATPADVAALVNGQPISMSFYQAQLQTAIASYSQQSVVDPKTPEGKAALDALREQVLDWLIDRALTDQAAAREGIQVDEAQVNAEFERIRQQKPDGFADWLKNNGFTEETFRAQIRSDLLGAAVRERVTQGLGGKVEQVQVSHILVDSEAEARAALDRLRQGSIRFEALVKQISQDEATRNNGGDLGFVPRGILPESLEAVAFSMKEGQISDPVQSPFGWHILKLVKRDPAREIAPDTLATLRQDAFMRWLEAEREKAKIETFIGR